MDKRKTIWGRYDLKNETTFQFSGGLATVTIKRLSNGWTMSKTMQPGTSDKLVFETCESSQPTENEEIFQTGRSDILHVLPALPLKPVVLRSNKTIKVSPKQTIKLFLSIPLSVQFYFAQVDGEHLMFEFSLNELSDTWFGETDVGEPAYSLGQRFALFSEDIKLKTFEALCPVKITNNSNHLLELDRLIIRVENLSVYLKSGQLITSMFSIDFKGPVQSSTLSFSTDKGFHGEQPVLIAKARNPVIKTFLAKSFQFIKHLTQ
jgi:hypothetical protein